MSDCLPPIKATRKIGDEPFHAAGRGLGFDLLSFWRWSASDLVSNTARGILAEYLVARALGLAQDEIRDEWGPVDLITRSGVKVQVKSAAFLQAWYQKGLSQVVFSTRPTRSWDADTNTLAREPTRHADVYVFALLAHCDKATLDPMDVEQWRFYVVPRSVLDRDEQSQHSITLKSLEAISRPVCYSLLAAEVADCSPPASS